MIAKITSYEISILARMRNDLLMLADEEETDPKIVNQLIGMSNALRAILRAHNNPNVVPQRVTAKGLLIEWPNTAYEMKEAMK